MLAYAITRDAVCVNAACSGTVNNGVGQWDGVTSGQRDLRAAHGAYSFCRYGPKANNNQNPSLPYSSFCKSMGVCCCAGTCSGAGVLVVTSWHVKRSRVSKRLAGLSHVIDDIVWTWGGMWLQSDTDRNLHQLLRSLLIASTSSRLSSSGPHCL